MFDISDTGFPELLQMTPKLFADQRGKFIKTFHKSSFAKLGIETCFKEQYYSVSYKNVIRGMHFQLKPFSEEKIITCLNGSVFDVVVDLRYGSPTFLQWHAEILSSENNNSLLIPEGCAHGFQALENDCKLLYLHTELYNPDFEGSLNVMDPMIGINWPIPFSEISDKDANQPFIDKTYLGVFQNEM